MFASLKDRKKTSKQIIILVLVYSVIYGISLLIFSINSNEESILSLIKLQTLNRLVVLIAGCYGVINGYPIILFYKAVKET